MHAVEQAGRLARPVRITGRVWKDSRDCYAFLRCHCLISTVLIYPIGRLNSKKCKTALWRQTVRREPEFLHPHP
jgi:hypothetical protein